MMRRILCAPEGGVGSGGLAARAPAVDRSRKLADMRIIVFYENQSIHTQEVSAESWASLIQRYLGKKSKCIVCERFDNLNLIVQAYPTGFGMIIIVSKTGEPHALEQLSDQIKAVNPNAYVVLVCDNNVSKAIDTDLVLTTDETAGIIKRLETMLANDPTVVGTRS